MLGGKEIMKKLACLFAAAVLLAGCGGSGDTEKKGTATSPENDKGQAATVEVTLKGDDITAIAIDETYEGSTKKALKEDYDMKKASGIGKEWYEQAAFLENYIVEKGIDAVAIDESGYPTGDDVKTGCTMNVKTYLETAKEAVKAAK